MSRSNPTDNSPNPAQRWYEWDGSNGIIRYWDKKAVNPKGEPGMEIQTKLPFMFIVLDETATVKGWHDASDSGIYSNEVRDTRQETLVVKAFKGGMLAEGFYAEIRDRILSHGGHFTANLYIAFKDGKGVLQIGALQFKGAALNQWVEFRKAHRDEVMKKGIAVTGFTDGKKGNIKFRTPVFEIKDVSEKTNAEAVALDMLLQNYLKGYFKRTRTEQVARPAAEPDDGYQPDPEPEPQPDPEPEPEPPSDVPF